MTNVAITFARGGSKGLPGKNLREFNGIPLIAHAINQAKAANVFDRVMVSTDCTEIARISKQFGAEVPFMRPPEYSGDKDPEWLAWRHAVNFLTHDLGLQLQSVTSIPATSPLRTSTDIVKVVDHFRKSNFDMVMTITESHKNPWFNMVCQDKSGELKLANQPKTAIHRRQDAPKVFDLTTVCNIFSPKFIINSNSHFEGKIGGVIMPKIRAIDIDDELDFLIAEQIQRYLNNV
jgi:N-acylneuraminate cytidylyltransferase